MGSTSTFLLLLVAFMVACIHTGLSISVSAKEVASFKSKPAPNISIHRRVVSATSLEDDEFGINGFDESGDDVAVETQEYGEPSQDSSIDWDNIEDPMNSNWDEAPEKSGGMFETNSHKDTSVEVLSGKDCKQDGTTCQYSRCGRGRGLPTCAFGFAGSVSGGARGVPYVVTRSDDNPSHPQRGSLRYGVQLAEKHTGGVWITFSKSMVIPLQSMLWLKSSTTIDGRDVNVTIAGRCLALGNIKNVILHNFQINTVGESDTIHIFGGSRNIWVDHITTFDAKLGLISVVQGATDVTISNCYLKNHNFNMLLGASDADKMDKDMRVTVFRNWFKDSYQRMPHCRWGYCHVVNNLYTNWGYYAIGGRVHAKVVSESNVFMPGRRQEVTPWFQGASSDLDQTSTIQSRNDLYVNGATFHQFIPFGVVRAPKYKQAPPVLPPKKVVRLIKNCAGALFGQRLKICNL